MSDPWVIVTNARCGTNMLGTALGNHPALEWRGEVYNPGVAGRIPGDAETIYRRHQGPGQGFAIHNYRRPGTSGRSPFLGAWRIIERERPRVIILDRRDQLRRIASWHNAERRGNWESTCRVASLPPLVLTPDQVRFGIDSHLESMAMFRRTFRWALRTDYEALTGDWGEETQRIQEYLGIAPRELTPATVKLDSRPIREILGNYDDLREHFSGSYYEPWFWFGSRGGAKVRS